MWRIAVLTAGLVALAGSSPAGAATTRCHLRPADQVRGSTLLALRANGTSCDEARHVVQAYRRCRARGCGERIYRRCVQTVFLGGCRLHHRFIARRAGGYRCIERRLYEIGARYEAHVSCHRGGRHVAYDYTLFTDAPIVVRTEAALRAAWANPRVRTIVLARDITLRACRIGDPIRESALPVTVDGRGHTLRQGCFEKRLFRQDGTGFVRIKAIRLTRGGTDGPGAAVTTRGEIEVVDSRIQKNLSEEPGGGVFAQRGATIIRSVITGNLANDDGGGVYARRGGIRVFDSIVSSNLVDGSGGALGSTGDIVVVRSHIDGNTTDGDGGAIYTDEAGDVTVIDSTVDGSTADGPGGAVFTLGGDVTVIRSTLNGNRADDRGGAISGESDVTVIDSTIARNAAVAHVGGGIWARGDLYVANSTVTHNYAEGQGGGILAAGVVSLDHATVADNASSVAANVGAGERMEAFASIIGPATTGVLGGQVQTTERSCQVGAVVSRGYNIAADPSCELAHPTDLVGVVAALGPLAGNGGLGETRLPAAGSAALDRIPPGACGAHPFGERLKQDRHLVALPEISAAWDTADQRGVARPVGPGCDVGAAELGP